MVELDLRNHKNASKDKMMLVQIMAETISQNSPFLELSVDSFMAASCKTHSSQVVLVLSIVRSADFQVPSVASIS